MLRHPSFVVGYHSCSKQLGERVVLGIETLKGSQNPWDWLGYGVYFWEQNLGRAIDYANEIATDKQFNRRKFRNPCVVGALLELGTCLSLVEDKSLKLLTEAYSMFQKSLSSLNMELPVNRNNNRALDCAVIEYLHRLRATNGDQPFDTVRCAFSEGGPVFPGSSISAHLHLQVCVRNKEMIRAYFLP